MRYFKTAKNYPQIFTKRPCGGPVALPPNYFIEGDYYASMAITSRNPDAQLVEVPEDQVDKTKVVWSQTEYEIKSKPYFDKVYGSKDSPIQKEETPDPDHDGKPVVITPDDVDTSPLNKSRLSLMKKEELLAKAKALNEKAGAAINLDCTRNELIAALLEFFKKS